MLEKKRTVLGHFFPIVLIKPFPGSTGPGPVSTVEI